MASILKELHTLDHDLQNTKTVLAFPHGERSARLSTKNAEQIVFGIMQLLFRPVDWHGLIQEFFEPVAQRLFVAGVVESLAWRAAVLPGSEALRKLELFKRGTPTGFKATSTRERLQELGVTIPAGIKIELPPWLQDRMAEAIQALLSYEYWVGVGEQVGQDVGRILQAGILEGKSIGAIAKLLEEAVPDYSRRRATLVARTETAAILNAGQIAVMEEMELRTDGLLGDKFWLSVIDARTRPAHVDANGQKRRIREKFIVGGEECDYPGDPELSPSQRINCRCAVISGDILQEASEAEG